jgi:RES domain-containing protein
MGGRWNPPDQFNAIYGSLDPETAIAESLGTYSVFGISAEKARPRVFVAIRLKLQSVLDFASPRAATTLGLDYAALARENWQSLQDAGAWRNLLRVPT